MLVSVLGWTQSGERQPFELGGGGEEAQSCPQHLLPLNVIVAVEISAAETRGRKLQPVKDPCYGHGAHGQINVVPATLWNPRSSLVRRVGFCFGHVRNEIRDLGCEFS